MAKLDLDSDVLEFKVTIKKSTFLDSENSYVILNQYKYTGEYLEFGIGFGYKAIILLTFFMKMKKIYYFNYNDCLSEDRRADRKEA